MTAVLGLSAYYHDAAAALAVDGTLVAAAQEERFSRQKNDERFPEQAVAACLKQAGLRLEDVDVVCFYEKPLLKFDRILEAHLSAAPGTFPQFRRGLPLWLDQKLFMRRELARGLGGRYRRAIAFLEHHEAHAAAAFFPSPFDDAAILTVDGVGEHATTTLGHGRGRSLELSHELRFPHSLGLLYSAFTQYAGFEVNTGEYMLMGLAPYGEPRFESAIREHLVDLKPDGSFRLDLRYFDFVGGLSMISPRFEALFGGPARAPGGPVEQRHRDAAASIQRVTEDILLRLARTAHRQTGSANLCLGGGCALNSVAVGKIRREGPFERVWVQPAAGDAGSAIGAALFAWHHVLGHARAPPPDDAMQSALLGPAFDHDAIRPVLDASGLRYRELAEPELLTVVVDALVRGDVVGWFQGRMEFGPRALGGRSILADPRVAAMKDTINRKIKFREGFRPFAPAALREEAHTLFETAPGEDLPYMTHVVPVRPDAAPAIPAVTHVDGTARVQTLSAERHGRTYRLVRAFFERTGCAAVLNTSFNVRGEPIVCQPADALRCFARTELDALVLEGFVVEREGQPEAALQALRDGGPAARRDGWLERRLRPEQRHPGRSQLLGFGLLLAVAGALAGWLVDGRGLGGPALPVGLGVGALLGLVAQAPPLGRPLYRGWLALGVALGAIVSPVVLFALYVTLITPVALVRRWLGRDPLGRTFERAAPSYLRARGPRRDAQSYLRQY